VVEMSSGMERDERRITTLARGARWRRGARMEKLLRDGLRRFRAGASLAQRAAVVLPMTGCTAGGRSFCPRRPDYNFDKQKLLQH
jgi:hypothetical protein